MTRKSIGVGGFLLAAVVAGSLLTLRGQTSHTSEGVTTITVWIDGPSCCGYCPASLDVALAELNGVVQTNTDYELGLTQIKYDGGEITLPTIFETIKGRGYKVISVVAD